MAEGFVAGDWIERLAQLLPPLTQVLEPYLQDDWQDFPRTRRIVDGRDVTPFPLDDVRILYQRLRDSWRFGEEAYFAPLRAALDPVRHALLAHPALARAVGRIIGQDTFYMQLPGSGADTSAGDLIAGLMARAAELPQDGFRTAIRELNAFLSPVGDGAAADTLGSLDEACDMFLFYGLTLPDRIEVEDGMVLLPYAELLRFVDEETVRNFAPSGAGFHGWGPVGAVARPFRWRPELRRRVNLNEPVRPTPSFFPKAAVFLDLLAVSHATRIAPLAALSNRIDGSAGRLLGRETQSPGFHQRWSAEGLSGFDRSPEVSPEALAEALEAFHGRQSARYERMAPIVTRLSEALARNGRFAAGDRVQDVAMALERMYVLDENKIGRKLRSRTARFLGTDAASEKRISDEVQELYDVRSNIVHNRLHKLTPDRVHSAFVMGFDLARQSLFRLLREGPPADWAGAGGDGRQSGRPHRGRIVSGQESGERPDA